MNCVQVHLKEFDFLENEVLSEEMRFFRFDLFSRVESHGTAKVEAACMCINVWDICTRKREVEGVGRLGSGNHARHARGEHGNREEYFYCSSSCLRVAFPGHWADPLKT